jgi:hypothetical protein
VALSDRDYCRVKAHLCGRLAEAASSDDVKARLLKLEQRWLENAAGAYARSQAFTDLGRKSPAAYAGQRR